MELPNWIYWILLGIWTGLAFAFGLAVGFTITWWFLNKSVKNENDYEGI
jgi:high-affinity Fe2+/Pb2+ permease